MLLLQEDYDNAIKYLERAADKGDYQAMFQLGIIMYDGLGSKGSQVSIGRGVQLKQYWINILS